MTLNGSDVTARKLDSSNRARKTVRFELNLIDTEQVFILEILTWWKHQKKMATNIRKAILLFYDLMQGKTNKLQEYFPLVVAALTGEAVQDHADGIVQRVTVVIETRVGEVNRTIAALPASNQSAVDRQ